MEPINFILQNMLKRQLINVYFTFEEESPELLADPAVLKGYEALKSVSTHEELEQWGKLMEVLGLSYKCTDAPKRKDNVLGELDDLVYRADWNVVYEFLSFKGSFDATQWDEVQQKNYKLISAIRQMAERSYDVHIIVILCDNQWVAIGDDANRLFEIFGWQTSSVFDGESDVSYMFISDYGMKVLYESDFSIKTLFLRDEDIDDNVFISDSFNEDMVCATQQYIDYLRFHTNSYSKLHGLLSDKITHLRPMSGYDLLVNGDISISEDKVVVKTDINEEVTLVDGRNWRLDEVGLPYFINFRPVSGLEN